MARRGRGRGGEGEFEGWAEKKERGMDILFLTRLCLRRAVLVCCATSHKTTKQTNLRYGRSQQRELLVLDDGDLGVGEMLILMLGSP